MSKEKNKVLMVGMTGGVGGVESFICNLTDFLDNSKFQVDFLVHQEINEKYLECIKENGVNVYTVCGIKNGIFKYIKSIFKFYKENQYDIVHLNECGASFFIYVLPLLFHKKVKLVVHSHNGDSSKRFLHKVFKIVQNKRADAKWTCSDVAAEWMFGKKDAINSKIIHNGIDIEKYKFNEETRDTIRNELNINKDAYVIGSIARFEEQKNHNKIIEIFEAYTNINPNSVLILVGNGSKRNEIETLVNEKKELVSKIIFLDIRNDVNRLLMGFDLFLLPSLYEGLPFVTVESQAASLPILASDTVSNQINLTDLVYREKLEADGQTWADKINSIANKKIDRNNVKYVNDLINQGYDIKTVAKLVEKEYEKLIKNEEK